MKKPRGMVWHKQTQRTALAPAHAPPLSPSFEEKAGTNATGIGPQRPGDKPFTARLRLHQSWYRACVLQVPCGTGPKPLSTRKLGNMLTRADGAENRNFLTPEIAQVARARLQQGRCVEPFRLCHNLLSSQPMCFNLFSPLALDRRLAATLLPSLVPERIAEVTRVSIEWAPEPARAYLADKTSFDTFIEYRATDGRLCALGIETKLTDSFSQKLCDGEKYRRWMRAPVRPWRPEADPHVSAIAHNQLWRNHLLAVALRDRPQSHYATSRLLVVHHPGDHECVRVCAGYRALLCDGDDTMSALSLDRIIDAWSSLTQDPAHTAWLQAFQIRYLDLKRSADAR
ncbi:MAG TPA: hypothetical protein VJU61_28350 [Polyangiaceae bacterium]|nr:hypothetical protein [Polyangiaceae bacterium]